MRPISIMVLMFVLLCGCASSPPPAASSPSAGGNMPALSKRFALTGSNGLLVEVVDFQNGEALLRVSGMEGPLQNKVLLQKRTRDGQDLRYTMPWGGRERLTLLLSGQSDWIGTYWQLYIPGGGEAIPVSYSDSDSGKVDAESMFAAHEKLRKSGELEELQRFHPSADRAQEDEAVANSAAATSRECGAPVTAAIAWETVSDQALREHTVADWCTCALHALSSACLASPEAKSFVRNQVQSVSCRLDGAGEMNVDAGRLSWSVSFEQGDLDSLASKAFGRLYLPQ
jgi:hypothetical protein